MTLYFTTLPAPRPGDSPSVQIKRLSLEETLVEDWRGLQLNSPNDVVVRRGR